MLRARPVAGDPDVARRFMALLEDFVWQRGVSDDDVREIRRTKARIERERIPPREDPAFHLKLGRGSLSDVEWTVQLLQLARGIRSPSTSGALDALVEHGVLDRDATPTCSPPPTGSARPPATGCSWSPTGAENALPPQESTLLLWLARSLETTPSLLREDYRRVTRRARRVVERVFYGQRCAMRRSTRPEVRVDLIERRSRPDRPTRTPAQMS